jgi:ABC-type transport system substrate-binding protein
MVVRWLQYMLATWLSVSAAPLLAQDLSAENPAQAVGDVSAGNVASTAGAGVAAADRRKVLRYVISAPESGFDPAIVHDIYSSAVIESVMETLYTYDYLARPATLVPLTAQSLPEISDDGLTYTLRLKKGIYFASDPAFGGKRRELVIQDYLYAWKRLLDPRLRSANSWLLDGKIRGMDKLLERARRSGTMDYMAPVAGLEVLDRYSVRVHLAQPDFNFGMILAHQPLAPLAREVVERYRDQNGQVMANPVGTGPYRLARWVRGSRITLEANPDYRHMVWDFQPGSDPADLALVAKMKGKRIPQIDRVEISVITEDNARWLSFRRDEQDVVQLGGALVRQALDGDHLKPELARQGIQLSRLADLGIRYTYWNMQDPTVGGLTPEKIALRRAIAMAHDMDREIEVVYDGEAVRLSQPVPPGVVGHDPDYLSSLYFAPHQANLLLDRYGYQRGADGWRRLPDGSPLLIRYAAVADGGGRQMSEAWKKTYDSLYIRMVEDFRPFPELLKAEKACQLQSRSMSWVADYPDADNFMQLFYGPNVGISNNGCQRLPEFDRLYAQAQRLPDSPERQALLRKMWRVLEVYMPAMINYARVRTTLMQPRVLGYKNHPLKQAEWIYSDVELERKAP